MIVCTQNESIKMKGQRLFKTNYSFSVEYDYFVFVNFLYTHLELDPCPLLKHCEVVTMHSKVKFSRRFLREGHPESNHRLGT